MPFPFIDLDACSSLHIGELAPAQLAITFILLDAVENIAVIQNVSKALVDKPLNHLDNIVHSFGDLRIKICAADVERVHTLEINADIFLGNLLPRNARLICRLDNFVVNVPNNNIANQAITNVSQAKKRLVDITVGVEYGTSNEKLDRAVQILREIAHDSEDITGDGIFTSIEALADSSINLRLFSYTPEISWFKYKQIKGAVIREIIHRFRAEGISFAFPSVSVYKGDSDSEN